MFKKFICCITAICIVMLSCVPALAAASESKESAPHPDIQRIFDDYHARCAEIEFESNSGSRAAGDAERLYSLAKSDAIAQLEEAGYLAYDVNSNTYDSIEDTLATDFSQMGLDPDGSYIVVIAGETPPVRANSDTSQSRSTVYDSFTHTYNGYTCTLRYVIVTAADDSAYSLTNDYEIINGSTTYNTLYNILNTLISSTIDSYFDPIPLGTLLSICGAEIEQYDSPQPVSIKLEARATWTREYTQVYEENSGLWLSWVSVDDVLIQTWIVGNYYSPSLNMGVNFSNDKSVVRRVSEHYNDMTWRKNQAIWGWHLGAQRNEYVGNVSIYYGGSRVMYFSQPMRPAP